MVPVALSQHRIWLLHQAGVEGGGTDSFCAGGAKQGSHALAHSELRHEDKTKPKVFSLQWSYGWRGAAGMPHPILDLRDTLLLSWGCVCTGRIWPLPCVKQRQDSVCELDFTRHQMRCSRVEIGSQSSFLLVPSSSPLLLPPRWVDVLIK